MISVIIPTFNEVKHEYIQKSFEELSLLENSEVIIVDSYSQDQTVVLAQKYNFKVIQINTPSRAARLKEGIKLAKGDILLLHHPRSFLRAKEIAKLHDTKISWGAFTHKFDMDHWLLRFTSFWSNSIRSKSGIYYLDHCLFFQSSLANKVLKIPDMDIFEDTEICKILRKIKKPIRMPGISLTSAVRFKTNGIFKQALLNQILKFKYLMGANHQKMNKVYESELELNSKYDHREL